jgi:predicted transcriptional regulator
LAILTYAIIDNQKTTNPFGQITKLPVSCIAYDTMAEKYNIRKATAIKAVGTLRDNKLLDYEQLPTGRNKEVFNVYKFPVYEPTAKIKKGITEPYKEVDTNILNLNLTAKERGILLMFHLLSQDTSEIVENETDMAKKLGMTVRTLKKYIELFTNKGLLFKNRLYYTLKQPKQSVLLAL